MRSALRLLTSGLLIALLCAAAFAQGSQTGGLTGVITDPQGAVVPGASVQIVNEKTGKAERTTTTGADGAYAATLLTPGTYSVEVTAKNFKKTVVTSVEVRITETTRQDVTLTVGGVTETVEVQAEAT
nr:carboxypeptidase-like regulatory domain-containing protein [Acidobacteriota bacterium]